MGFCNCSMFCCALLCVNSSFAIISVGKRGLVALLCLSSWDLMIVSWLILTMLWVYLQFLIVVFSEHTHLLFLTTFWTPITPYNIFLYGNICYFDSLTEHDKLSLFRYYLRDLIFFVNEI